MRTYERKSLFSLLITLFVFINCSYGSKLATIQVVDQEYLMLHFVDGEVKLVDDGIGPKAFENHPDEANNNYIVSYGSPLNLDELNNMENWTIRSDEDEDYGSKGLSPTALHRKTKVNGMAQFGWINEVPYNDFGDYDYHYTYEHYIYLQLPKALKQGKSYELHIQPQIKSNDEYNRFTFDFYQTRSEAIHINLTGYTSSPGIKAADLYMWMGDGGGRDLSVYEGNTVYLFDVKHQKAFEAGKVKFGMSSQNECFEMDTGGFDLIKSKVWHADFTGFNRPGTYRLAVEGIGCSPEFEITANPYFEPYRVSTLGYYYMRLGESKSAAIPVPRQPQWIPNKAPSDCKIVVTDMDPYHPDWDTQSGDKWDQPDFFAKYVKPGNPENPNAVGGHSDALDWDRHLGHVSNIYDMLLPYFLSGGALDEDNLGIAESGNGIPDILDEARNEVDFWLSLRYQDGYSHGITNPTKNSPHILYQADNTGVAAWANAANAAMLSDCFRLAGNHPLSDYYRWAAEKAYNYASNLKDTELDRRQEIGEGVMRGRDFKALAAAFLFNVTGKRFYEDALKAESVVTAADSQIDKKDVWNQLWATAAYLKTPHTPNYPELYDNMKASICYQAKKMEAEWFTKRASRRAVANNLGYYWTLNNVQRTIIAHSVTEDTSDKELFRDALLLEAGWSLGRNPANMILMTTASTKLESKRSVEMCYTTGQDDGTPGLHPGHTPYFNIHNWAPSMLMGSPGKLLSRNYPKGLDKWPRAELFCNTTCVWAHSEFTPRQTMRGKAALYGYLHAILNENS